MNREPDYLDNAFVHPAELNTNISATESTKADSEFKKNLVVSPITH